MPVRKLEIVRNTYIILMAACPLCLHSDRERLEAELAKGNITKKMLAQELQMTVEQVHEHMTNHFSEGGIKKEDLRPSKLREAYNKRDILFNTMIALKERLDLYLNKDTFSSSETKQIILMAGELRKSIMDLANLENELKTEQHVTINLYNNLKMMVLTVLCPECRKAVMEELDAQEKKLVDEMEIESLMQVEGKVK